MVMAVWSLFIEDRYQNRIIIKNITTEKKLVPSLECARKDQKKKSPSNGSLLIPKSSSELSNFRELFIGNKYIPYVTAFFKIEIVQYLRNES